MKNATRLILTSIFLFLFSLSLLAKTIAVISFNDFHGAIQEDTTSTGKNLGMAKFVTMVKNVEKKYKDNFIVVAAGDNYQGSTLSILTKGKLVSEMFKELQVAASAVGNHEFDWGIKYFKQWEKDGNFQFLAANIINKKTGKPVTWAKPYLIINEDHTKIRVYSRQVVFPGSN